MAALKKARQQYYQRCDELEKAKAVSAKAADDTTGTKTLDKRRKSKDEAQTKVNVLSMHCNNMIYRNAAVVQFSIENSLCRNNRDLYWFSGTQVFLCLHQVMEAEFLYKNCVKDAKIHQDVLVKVKEKIISHIRKLICQGDTVLKEVGMKLKKLNICLPVNFKRKSINKAAFCHCILHLYN